MKCLVTGGAGFIGNHLVRRLLADGAEVRIADDLATGTNENLRGVPEAELARSRAGAVGPGTTREWSTRRHRGAAGTDQGCCHLRLDTDTYRPGSKQDRHELVVGWIGTHSTARYFETILPAIARCAEKHKFRVRIVGAGREIRIPGVDVENKTWRLDDEARDYQSLDIGLYPVVNDEWGQGKTGFKPVVYKASGAACIASPVGGVTKFLSDRVNGLFPSALADWEHAFERLFTDRTFRDRIVSEARRTVCEHYSLAAQAPRLAEVIRRATAG